MSVMSSGKKPKALVRPLRAGNSRTGARPGQFRAAEPGTAASRSERPRVPDVPEPAQRGSAVPARPRVTRKSPVRPRLWVVPDKPATAVPGTPESASSGPGIPGRAAPGSRVPGDGPVRRPLSAGSAPVVPRPRVALDEQIPARPGTPAASPGRSQPGWQDLSPGRTRRTGQAAPPTRAHVARTRVIRPSSAPSRRPAGHGGRGSPGAGAGWSGFPRCCCSWR